MDPDAAPERQHPKGARELAKAVLIAMALRAGLASLRNVSPALVPPPLLTSRTSFRPYS